MRHPKRPKSFFTPTLIPCIKVGVSDMKNRLLITSRFPQVNCAIHYPLYTIHYTLSTCPGCMLRSTFLHGGDTISPRGWYHIRTAQETSLHGARNFLARRKQAGSTAGTAHSHAGNRAFPRWECPVYMLKVCCFHGESMLFSQQKHAIFSQQKAFFLQLSTKLQLTCSYSEV